jgi:arylsulfatase A-like enzyme
MRARFGFRREFAAVVGTMLLGFCVCQSPAQAASTDKPNVVFLLADQWRAKATGYEGDPNVKTPNLDRLARQSLNFRNVVSVCPVCTPYRAALMTGRFPTSTGMFLNDVYLPDGELCFAEIFGQAGYGTAYIGKWHLDGHGRSEFVAPERRQGWDYWKAAECDHHYPRSHYYEGDSPEKQFWDGYDAFAQTGDAQSYLRRQAQADRPFVLMVSYGTPHFPHHTAPQEYKDLYPLDKIQLSPNVPPELQDTARREAQGYYAHCTALDKCVGDVLATLDETGLAPRTILVFTSDHGEMLGSHGKRPSMKQVPWDEAARVPFLLRYPAAHGPQGRDVPTPLTTPDILPTLLGLADVPLPDTLQGEDLSGLVRGQTEAADRAALYMSVAPFAGRGFNTEYRAIRTRRYTYVRNLEGPWLLFDDQQDPNQLDNLVNRAEFATLYDDLDARLQAQLQAIGDDFQPAQHYIDTWGYEVAAHGSVSYAPGARVQSPRHAADLKQP